MLNILLVDDEPLIFEVLKTSIPWNDYDMQVAGCVTDGVKALKFLEENEVDIVFTDLKMPFMDGIELVKTARKLMPNILFVILSSYSDFPLVKQAFKEGAVDYILKVDVDSQEVVMPLLNNIRRSALTRLKEEAEMDIESLMLSRLRRSIKSLDTKKYAVLAMEPILPEIYTLSDQYGKTDDFFSFIHNGACYFVTWTDTNNPTIVENLPLIDLCRQNINMEKQRRIIIGVSGYGLIHELGALKNQALSLLDLGYYEQESRIFFHGRDLIPDAANLPFIEIKEEIQTCITTMNIKLLIETIDKLFDHIEGLRMPKKVAQTNLINIFMFISNRLMDMELLPKEIQYTETHIIDKIKSFNQFNELEKWFAYQMKIVYNDQKLNNAIQTIKSYVEQNFSKQDITLDNTAKLFNMSSSSLSKLFLYETGIHFKEYLNTLRINSAKYYLCNTQLNISEICEKVGYANLEHFSRFFSQKVGVAPTEYRRKYKEEKIRLA